MSPTGVLSDAAPGGSGGSGGAVNFGDLDVTFSAPFYTGVFLSSREMQGNYECHQNIVIEGMEEKLRWGWNSPSDISEFWRRKVSPPYFIGAEKSNQSSPVIRKVKCYIYLSGFRYGFRYDSLELKVKFFEPGFGLVSVRLSGLVHYQGAVFSAKNFERFLADREGRIRQALDSIAQEITRAYRSSVPCCIKNSDIWDINNFGGLEATEGMCGIGSVQEINTVVAMQHSDETNFINLTSEFKKVFVDFSEKLRKPPFNGSYNLFSTKEQNTTIVASMIQNHDELEDIIDVSEVLGVQLAVGRYFNNFFFSYYNYVACEYELITSRNMHRFGNIKKIRNLMEKFLDCKKLYSQVHKQIIAELFCTNSYDARLLSLWPQSASVQKIWNNSDQSVKEIFDIHKQISSVRSEHSFLTNLDMLYVSIFISSFVFGSVILLELFDGDSNYNQWFLGILAVLFLVLSSSYLALINVPGKVPIRKLYYICGLQKKDLREQYKEQEKRNESKGSCICEVKKCHRCRGSKWHSRIFYRDENLCFRCGKKER